MAKRSVLMFVFVAALLAGCAGADTSVPEDAAEGASPEATAPVASSPSTAASCEELADDVIAQVQVIVDELSDATLEDLGRDDLLPPETEQELDQLGQRVEDSGCDEEEMERLLADRADRIQGEGVIADAVREGLDQSGELPF